LRPPTAGVVVRVGARENSLARSIHHAAAAPTARRTPAPRSHDDGPVRASSASLVSYTRRSLIASLGLRDLPRQNGRSAPACGGGGPSDLRTVADPGAGFGPSGRMRPPSGPMRPALAGEAEDTAAERAPECAAAWDAGESTRPSGPTSSGRSST